MLILVFVFLFLGSSALAAPPSLKNSSEQLGTAAGQAGYGNIAEGEAGTRVEYIIAQIIRIVLSFLGVLFLILTIYGGFKWMTAHGNEEQLTKAKKLIVEATIGLIIVLASYIITFYVINKLLGVIFNIDISP